MLTFASDFVFHILLYSATKGAMTKEEVERLLRHGAYDIFNEEKAGTAEAESNAFVQQDIDTILERRSRTVIHENTGTGSTAAGGTFSKASFVAPKGQSTQSGDQPHEDVDIEDPDFWKKMVGEAQPEAESVLKPRNRRTANYSEKMYERRFRQIVQESDGGNSSGSDSDESDDSSDGGDSGETERLRWGGRGPDHWTKAQAYSVLSLLERYGYGVRHKELKTILTPDFSTFSNDKVSGRRVVGICTSLIEILHLHFPFDLRSCECCGPWYSCPFANWQKKMPKQP